MRLLEWWAAYAKAVALARRDGWSALPTPEGEQK